MDSYYKCLAKKIKEEISIPIPFTNGNGIKIKEIGMGNEDTMILYATTDSSVYSNKHVTKAIVDENGKEYEYINYKIDSLREKIKLEDIEKTLKKLIEKIKGVKACKNCGQYSNCGTRDEFPGDLCMRCQLDNEMGSEKFDCDICQKTLGISFSQENYCQEKHDAKICEDCYKNILNSKNPKCPYCRKKIRNFCDCGHCIDDDYPENIDEDEDGHNSRDDSDDYSEDEYLL